MNLMKLTSIARGLLATAILVAPAIATAQTTQKGKKMQDIVAVAAGAGQFTTLVAAVKAAGLVETLQGEGPFTVFAPTDDAFAKLPKGALDALLANNEMLTAILTYHVVPGRLSAADVVAMGEGSPATVNGAPVRISVRSGAVYVDNAKVTKADIQASNGVIHVLDTVIMPAPATAGAGN